MKTHFLVSLLLTTLIFSCKKDNNDIAATTAVKVSGRWNIDSIVLKQKFNGIVSIASYPGTAADFIEFRSDGNMETQFQGDRNVSTFNVRDNTVITIGGDSGSIIELTDTKFVLFTRAEAGSLGYLETTYYLRK